jgi:hypothetical protein
MKHEHFTMLKELLFVDHRVRKFTYYILIPLCLNKNVMCTILKKMKIRV